MTFHPKQSFLHLRTTPYLWLYLCNTTVRHTLDAYRDWKLHHFTPITELLATGESRYHILCEIISIKYTCIYIWTCRWLSKKWYAKYRIYNGCPFRIKKKSVADVTRRHLWCWTCITEHSPYWLGNLLKNILYCCFRNLLSFVEKIIVNVLTINVKWTSSW